MAMMWINNMQKRRPSAMVRRYRRRKIKINRTVYQEYWEPRNASFMSKLSRRLKKLFAKKGK